MDQPGSMKSPQCRRGGSESVSPLGKGQRPICQGGGEISGVFFKENQLFDSGAGHTGLESGREDLAHFDSSMSGGSDRVEFSKEALGAEEAIFEDVSDDSSASALFPDDAAQLFGLENGVGSSPLDRRRGSRGGNPGEESDLFDRVLMIEVNVHPPRAVVDPPIAGRWIDGLPRSTRVLRHLGLWCRR